MAKIKPINFDAFDTEVKKLKRKKIPPKKSSYRTIKPIQNVTQTKTKNVNTKVAANQQTESLATVAFIIALIPGLQVIGMIIAFSALKKIKNDPKLKGSGFCVIAIVFGILEILTLIIIGIILIAIVASEGDFGDGITDCGTSTVTLPFNEQRTYEDDPAFECMGENLFDHCSKASMYVPSGDQGDLLYEILGASGDACRIQITFPSASEIGDPSSLVFADTSFACNVKLDSVVSNFEIEDAENPSIVGANTFSWALVSGGTLSDDCRGSTLDVFRAQQGG
ncbi:hypothetical protein CL622_03265 [archaeon]|nr:hypothetical protein [archaeon]|tara:strand:- start:908 stop:1750 length:843 start_codon:yes stop_codon:yes gene_type:complete